MNSMIKSSLAHSLVVLDYRPAHEWTAQEVSDALQQCLFEKDIVGAEAIYARLKNEFQVLYDYSFDKHPNVPDVGLTSSCKEAYQTIQEIRKLN